MLQNINTTMEEDLIIFSPRPKSLPTSPDTKGSLAEGVRPRPTTADPALKSTNPLVDSQEIIARYKTQIIDNPTHKHQYPPPISGGHFLSSHPNHSPVVPVEFAGPAIPAVPADPASAAVYMAPAHMHTSLPSPSGRSFTSCGRNVVISNLPDTIATRDVLKRIRGGKVLNCSLAKFRIKGMVEPEVVAVVTFRSGGAAEKYARAFDAEGAQNTWKFSSSVKEDGSWAGIVTAHVNRYTQLPQAPFTALSQIQLDPQPPIEDNNIVPTRCLVVETFKFESLRNIWRDFDFFRLLSTPWYRSQVEDIWLDHYVRDSKHQIVSGRLHIRFTSIATATQTKSRVEKRSWASTLRFETDPCEYELASLEEPVDCHPGYQYLHDPLHLPMLWLFDHELLMLIWQDWRFVNSQAPRKPSHPLLQPRSTFPASTSASVPSPESLGPIFDHLMAILRSNDRNQAMPAADTSAWAQARTCRANSDRLRSNLDNNNNNTSSRPVASGFDQQL